MRLVFQEISKVNASFKILYMTQTINYLRFASYAVYIQEWGIYLYNCPGLRIKQVGRYLRIPDRHFISIGKLPIHMIVTITNSNVKTVVHSVGLIGNGNARKKPCLENSCLGINTSQLSLVNWKARLEFTVLWFAWNW